VNRIVLVTLWLIPVARLVSMLIDGSSGIDFTVLMSVEFVLAIWFSASTRGVWAPA